MPSSRQLPPRRVRQAVILVGGKGTRLGDLTKITPKPLMQIGEDRVFLDLLIDNIVRQGFERITLLAGYLGEQVSDRYHGKVVRGAAVEVVIEPEPLGTGGALRFAADLLDEVFLLANGDTYFDANYRRLEQALKADSRALAAIALRHEPDAARYGMVDLGPSGRITAFREKVQSSIPSPGDINAGVYVLNRAILGRLADGPSSLEQQVFPDLCRDGQVVGVLEEGYFVDIGLPATLTQARADLPKAIRRPAAFLDRDGVLNHDHGYVHLWCDYDWIDGAKETIRSFNDAGYFVFVVTNQAGVAHGYYEEAAILVLHDAIRDALAAEGAFIDCFYHCPFHPNGIIDSYRAIDHPHRKPAPGMVLDALASWPVDRERSFLIGDHETDIRAGETAGVRGYLFSGGSLLDFARAAGLVAVSWAEDRAISMPY